MARIPIQDNSYYARFFGNGWSGTVAYQAGTVVSFMGSFYEAQSNVAAPAEGAVNDNPTVATSVWTVLTNVPDELGGNRFITLEEAVNNYMVLYADEENHGGKAMRRKVEAFGQRAIQEFSYDTFRIKEEEYEVLDRAKFPFPQDLVEVVDVLWLDQINGYLRPIPYRKNSGTPLSPTQDQTGEFLYDNNGERLYTTNGSETLDTYNEFDDQREFSLRNGGGYNYGNYYTYGNRYYLDPERANRNGSYAINEMDGTIELDPSLMGEVIVVRYISDGLSSNIAEINFHKFAEQAVYDYIYWHMIMNKSRVPMNEKQRAQRAAYASRRTAKLRLSRLSPGELKQTLRNQTNWIKT